MEKGKAEFINDFLKEHNEFKKHVERVRNQYCEMRKLRENLAEGHIVVWMDFAENYICSSMDEVQSAYWNANMVTLHTQVVYFPASHNKNHMSVVGISEVMAHNATSVNAMIKKLLSIIKDEYPGTHTIHYLTDSPTSQYRNKTIFNLICAHSELYGCKATWDYLEAGHGKGPCDGLGASVKRSADMAVRQAKTQIQSAEDFYNWAKSEKGTSIKYFFVSSDEYKESEATISSLLSDSIPVPGTMKLHTAIPISRTQIAVREQSCYCDNCVLDLSTTPCSGWSVHLTKKMMPIQSQNNDVDMEPVHEVDETGDAPPPQLAWSTVSVNVGDFVAAVYQGGWYIGKVTELDVNDGEVLINFTTASNKTDTLKWPQQKDEIWVRSDAILKKSR